MAASCARVVQGKKRPGTELGTSGTRSTQGARPDASQRASTTRSRVRGTATHSAVAMGAACFHVKTRCWCAVPQASCAPKRSTGDDKGSDTGFAYHWRPCPIGPLGFLSSALPLTYRAPGDVAGDVAPTAPPARRIDAALSRGNPGFKAGPDSSGPTGPIGDTHGARVSSEGSASWVVFFVVARRLAECALAGTARSA